MEKGMLKFTCIILSLTAVVNMAHAACSIEPFTASQLVLMPTGGDSTNTAFTMQCDKPYNIRFNNINSGSSIGSLKYLNHSIRTQMFVESKDGKLNWNSAVAQPAQTKNRYIVTVRVAERISPLMPAGIYKDQISVFIEY